MPPKLITTDDSWARLGIFVVGLCLVAVVVGGCGGAPSDPTVTSLEELVRGQEDYDGQRIQTGGVVRRFGTEDGATRVHHVIEDAATNRVALVPGDLAAAHAEEDVVVIGRFRFAEDRGRRIEIESIEVTGPPLSPSRRDSLRQR